MSGEMASEWIDVTAEDARSRYRYYANLHWGAIWQHAEGYSRKPIRACYGCGLNDRRLLAASLVYDLATAEAHRVTGGPHPRLLGLTDGPALAVEAGVAWA